MATWSAPKFGRTDRTARSGAISFEDFQLTIPKPQKRTRPAIEGRPDLIPFGTAARKIGMEPKTFKRRVARGLIRGETQTLEASGGTWHFIHRDFQVVEPPPREPPLPPSLTKRARAWFERGGRPGTPTGILPRTSADGYACPLSSSPGSPIWRPARSVGVGACLVTASAPRCSRKPTTIYGRRCRTCQSRIEMHVAGIRAAALARGHAYDDGLAHGVPAYRWAGVDKREGEW